MREQTPKRLIVSIHDVTPAHRGRLERVEAFLAGYGLANRYAMLVVPDFWRRAPLRQDADFCRWLRGRAAAGVEMLLHGFTHRDESAHQGVLARIKATALTAREGEFLGLSRQEALERLHDGKALLEDIVGRPVTGFVAPAWLYGPGAHAALREMGFAIAEDQLSVWSPADGRVLSRAPVVSYASRTPARLRSSLLWSRAATRLLTPFHTVRLALHPHDFDAPALAREAARALGRFAAERRFASYGELL